MVEAYMVDFDGTLADTATANYVAYAAALEEVGVFVTRDTFEREACGRNWRQFLPGFLERQGSPAHPSDVAARKVHHYRAAARHVRFNEALIYLLTNRDVGTRTALVTSASAANVETVLAVRAGLRDLFDVVVTGDDVGRHKPDPQPYERAAALLQVAPGQCLVFEDSEVGVAAALAFGARVLKVCI
jgi:beta-phosphoglucomutase